MTIRLHARHLFAAAALAGAALLAGCASLHSVDAEVASFGGWPAGTAPGTYAFERLPSQDAQPARQQALERAAMPALAAAGFTPAAPGSQPAVIVQIGARTERYEEAPWDDPFWWGGRRRWAYPGWGGPWGPYGGLHRGPWAGMPPPDVYLTEVALLIRDTATGKPLYETRASTDGYASGGNRLLTAMFTASLKDFPATQPRMHGVRVELPPPAIVVPTPAPAASAPAA